MWRAVAVAIGLAGSVACSRNVAFNCQEAVDCGDGATCEPSGYCSFPDADCESGRRYGELAGAGLSGKCVVPQEATGSSGSTSNPGTVSGVTSLEPTTSDTGAVASSSSTGPSTTGMMVDEGSGTTTGIDPTGASSSGTTGTQYAFEDDFDREDSPSLDNGWIEENPSVFSIGSGAAVMSSDVSDSYEANLVMRPADEQALDVTVQAEVSWDGADLAGIPQIYTRVQPAWEGAGGFDGYLCFFSSVSNLRLRRQEGLMETELASEPLVGPLPSSPLTFRFSASGTDPVTLTCELLGPTFESLGTAVFVDESAARFQTPGVVGFSTHSGSQNFRYDDFIAGEAE